VLFRSIQHLQQLLEDEREESSRIRGEYEGLNGLLIEKEAFIKEAMDLLNEAEKQYQIQKERADGLQNATFTSAGELDDLRSNMTAELEKAKFDLEEMKATKERLETENDRMTKELAELSGDMPEGGRRERPNVMDAGAAVDMEVVPNNVPESNLIDESLASLSLDGHAAAAESARLQLTALLQRLGVMGSDVSNAVVTWSEQVFADQERWFKKAEEKFAAHERVVAEHNKKLREIEVQRSRLEKDLSFRTEKFMQLQSDMDNLKTLDSPAAAEFLADRERAHMKSLQQRLEQLVAVHRQLLRKFASLELENGELRKKITLRDERIRQLEQNSRAVTGQMRSQAERHISELTNLRDQIQSLRLEHQQKLDTKPADFQRHEGPRTVRGGHATASNEPRSLRGGGGAKPAPSPPEVKREQSTLFARLLGPKS